MKRKLLLLNAVLLLAAGLLIAFYPRLHQLQTDLEIEAEVQSFYRDISLQEHREKNPSGHVDPVSVPAESGDPALDPELPYRALYLAMLEHNRFLYESGQKSLSDPWSYQQEVFDLSQYGLEGEAVAILRIDRLDIELPVYLGATMEHMGRGAAQLSQTSMPIGGVNTNCVIAGHCGWTGALFFRYLSNLEVGDEIVLTNLWEELHYTVADMKIIDPTDVDKILIQEGRDLLTLLTCHPYGTGGRYRLVVYCERNYD
jgi:sortase A